MGSVNCDTSKMLKYIDYHLEAIVWEIPFDMKDTNGFSNKLKLTTSPMFFKISVPKNSPYLDRKTQRLQRSCLPMKFAKF